MTLSIVSSISPQILQETVLGDDHEAEKRASLDSILAERALQTQKYVYDDLVGKLTTVMPKDTVSAIKLICDSAPIDIRKSSSTAVVSRWIAPMTSTSFPLNSDWESNGNEADLDQGCLTANAFVTKTGEVAFFLTTGTPVPAIVDDLNCGELLPLPSFQCQLVQQDCGILASPACNVFFTPALTGCKFFSCQVGMDLLMFHVNNTAYSRSFVGVAFNICDRLDPGATDFSELIDLAYAREINAYELDLAKTQKDFILCQDDFENALAAQNTDLVKELHSILTELKGSFSRKEEVYKDLQELIKTAANSPWGSTVKNVTPDKVIKLAFLLSRPHILERLAAVNPPYSTEATMAAMKMPDGSPRNIFLATPILPVVFREGGRLNLYMHPLLQPMEPCSFEFAKAGSPVAPTSFDPPDFMTALRTFLGRLPGQGQAGGQVIFP